jgi:hypothetical protein
MERVVDNFFGAIKKRSDENQKALEWLLNEKIYSLVGSIIRMELDSLFRLCYYNSKSKDEQTILLQQFNAGQRWSGEKGVVTDRKMVEYLANTLMLTWAIPIYDIGCAFIHLSPYHDWNNKSDPTRNISEDVRNSIIEHIKSHHQKQLDADFTFFDLISVASDVFSKLRSNLLHELKKLGFIGEGDVTDEKIEIVEGEQ